MKALPQRLSSPSQFAKGLFEIDPGTHNTLCIILLIVQCFGRFLRLPFLSVLHSANGKIRTY